VWAAPPLMARKGMGWTLAVACAAASLAFLYLAFFSPPFTAWWRMPGIFVIGCSAGLLHTAIFHAVSPMYRHNPAATVNLAGILFGLGCLAVALFISRTFYTYTPAAIQIRARSRNTISDPASGHPITTRTPNSQAKYPSVQGASNPPAIANENSPL